MQIRYETTTRPQKIVSLMHARHRVIRRFQYLNPSVLDFVQPFSGLIDHDALTLDMRRELSLRMADFDVRYTEAKELIEYLATLSPEAGYFDPARVHQESDLTASPTNKPTVD